MRARNSRRSAICQKNVALQDAPLFGCAKLKSSGSLGCLNDIKAGKAAIASIVKKSQDNIVDV